MLCGAAEAKPAALLMLIRRAVRSVMRVVMVSCDGG
jgi:hypothetical protein